jgi:hypothetical protein
MDITPLLFFGGIILGAYVLYTIIASVRGRGSTLDPFDVFLTAWATGYVILFITYYEAIVPDVLMLLILLISFFSLWILIKIKLARTMIYRVFGIGGS